MPPANVNIKRAPIRSAIAGVLIAGAFIAYKYFAPELRVKVVAFPGKASKYLKKTFKGYDNYNQPIYEEVLTSIDPKAIALNMAETMSGITPYTYMDKYYNYINDSLTYNDLRLIHNNFLMYVDNKRSLYDWINAELEYDDTEVLQLRALKKLSSAGVGKRNVLKIPANQNFII